MRYLMGALFALAMVARPASAGDIQFKPIDTQKLVVQPSKTVAALTAKTISMVGNTTAGSLEQNGYVKTINNLFGFRRSTGSATQPGSSLPSPNVFKSTQYKSYNAPVMPVSRPR